MYAFRLFKRVNINEEGAEGHKLRTRTGMIKVLGLSHKRERQSDTKLSYFMFYNIFCMYSGINNE